MGILMSLFFTKKSTRSWHCSVFLWVHSRIGSFCKVVTSDSLSTQHSPVSGSVTQSLKSTPPLMEFSCFPRRDSCEVVLRKKSAEQVPTSRMRHEGFMLLCLARGRYSH